MTAPNPVLVEVTRDPMVESRHRGAAVVCDAEGRVVASWGDVDSPVYGRSAVKSIQALPLIETGAADAYGLGDAEIALACASHAGEPGHVDRVMALLRKLDLTPDDLECGGHFPYSEPTTAAMHRDGKPYTRAHDNCSGKHAAFLCTARHMGEEPQGYSRREHPVQQRVEQALAEVCGADTRSLPCGIDGCSIPVIGLPLTAMATGMARMAAPASLPPARAAAARRILKAVAADPFLISGTGRFDTVVSHRLGERALVKGGAEGMHCAALPGLGLGVAVKVEDGTGRASGVALGAILRRLGVITDEDATDLAEHLAPTLTSRMGHVVGQIRPADVLLGGRLG